MAERHRIIYRGSAPPAMLVSELRDAGLDVRRQDEDKPVLRNVTRWVAEAAVDHGVEMVVIGATHVVRSVIVKWRTRDPDAKIEWREKDGYR